MNNLKLIYNISIKHGLFQSYRYIWPLILLSSSIGYELAATRLLPILGDFYTAITDNNKTMFINILWKSVLVVTLIAILKTLSTWSKEKCALTWRKNIVLSIHELYFKSKKAYHIILKAQKMKKKIESLELNINNNNIINPNSSLDNDLESPLLMNSSSILNYKDNNNNNNKKKKKKKYLDNPDQRITQDVDLFTTSFAEFISNVIVVPLILIYYTITLVNLFGWLAPLSCFIYFIIAGIINTLLLKRVIPYIYKQEEKEGDFRYAHMWFRSNIESITMYNGINNEKKRISNYFNKVIDNQNKIISYHLPLYMSMNFFDYFGSIINYAAVGTAIIYISNSNDDDTDTASLVARGSFACLYLISAFSSIIDASKTATQVFGYIKRITELFIELGFNYEESKKLSYYKFNLNLFDKDDNINKYNKIENYNNKIDNNKIDNNNNNNNNNNLINDDLSYYINENENNNEPLMEEEISLRSCLLLVSGLCLGIPSHIILEYDQDYYINNINREINNNIIQDKNKLLIEDFNMKINEGKKYLIIGPSGIGKSSLLRVISGLWKPISGNIKFPAISNIRKEMMIIPQKSYLFKGTLIENICFPLLKINNEFEDQIISLLIELNLSKLIPFLSNKKIEKIDWPNRLSPGEQQKLTFLRVFLHKPKLLIMDESTSSLDNDMEEKIFKILNDMNITYISIGHKRSLLNYHDLLILFDIDSKWKTINLLNENI